MGEFAGTHDKGHRKLLSLADSALVEIFKTTHVAVQSNPTLNYSSYRFRDQDTMCY